VKAEIGAGSRDRLAGLAALALILAWLGLCVIGRVSFQGMPCCWAWSVVAELLRANRMSPMSSG
jgi:hypothetical protein